MIALILLASLAEAKKPAPVVPASWKCSDDVATDYKAGAAAVIASDWAKAETSFAAVLVAEPNCGLALTNLGRSRVMLGKFAEAEASLKSAAAQFADQFDPLLWLARAEIEGGKPDVAIVTARAAIALKPASYDAQRIVQRVLIGKKDTAGAHASIVEARKVANAAAWDCFDGIAYALEDEMGKAMSFASVCQGVPDTALYAEFTKALSDAVARSEAAAPPPVEETAAPELPAKK